jgi:hypothetical protein
LVDFVEEVEEQLRAERYASLANRFLPWFFAAIAATVVGWLGVWGYDTWRDRNIGQASIAYDKALVALSSGDQTGAFADLAPVAKDGPSAYRALALMMQADIRFGAGRSAEAVSLYDAAAKEAPNAVLRDLAGLRAAQTVMDSAPYAQVESRLKSLIGEKRPYNLEAREMLAMAKLQAGKLQEARGDFNALSLTLGVTPGMRTRAQGAITLIDSGQGGLVGPVVKAAATLPPSAAVNVPGLAGVQPPGGTPDAQDQGETPTQDSAQDPAGNPQ